MTRTGKFILWLLLVCAALMVVLIASFIVWRVHLAHEVNAQLQAIRAAGLPTNGEEANNYYTAVPDDENAAVKMADAFALLTNYNGRRSNEVDSIRFPQRKNALTSAQMELVAGWCAMNSNALAQAGEAIKLPRSRYPIDLSWGAGTLLPHLSKLKSLSRLAGFHALLDTNYAATSIQTIFGMAHTLDTEPVVISKLVRMAMVNIATATLERRLNAGDMIENDLVRLNEAFADALGTNQIANGLIGDRAMYIPYFRMSWAEINRLSNSSSDDTPEPSGPILHGSQPMFFRVTGFWERDLRFYLEIMQTNISFAMMSPPQSLLATNIQEGIWQTAKHNFYILSSMLLPAFGNMIIKEVTESTQVRTTLVALQIERYRLAHGRLPENLNELVPQFLSAVPEDPFDGQPLRYHRLTKGYVIYSVGRDGHDNGGREHSANAKSSDKTEYDITFTVER